MEKSQPAALRGIIVDERDAPVQGVWAVNFLTNGTVGGRISLP